MEHVVTAFSPNNWPGHLSYALIALSYWLTDIFRLRLVAVIGLSLEIVYFAMAGGDLRTGIGWDVIFIAINAYQLTRLVQDRLSFRLPQAERDLLRSVLGGLNDGQIVRLLSAGKFCEIARGTKLAEADQPLETLYFICDGHADVTIAGRNISQLGKGNFIGEVAFLTGRPATATVIAADPLRALVFEKATLSNFFNSDAVVAGLIYQLLGRELAHKIKVSNTLLSTT